MSATFLSKVYKRFFLFSPHFYVFNVFFIFLSERLLHLCCIFTNSDESDYVMGFSVRLCNVNKIFKYTRMSFNKFLYVTSLGKILLYFRASAFRQI